MTNFFIISFLLLNLFIINKTSDVKLANHFVLQMKTNDIEHAKQVLKDTGFRITRQVGSLNGVYMVEVDNRPRSKRSTNHSENEITESINSHPHVEIFEREKILSRKKRDFIELPILPQIEKLSRSIEKNKNEDPFWGDMWYLNRNLKDSRFPDMNVTGAWNQGYSGRGVSVTFLDDGLEWDHPDILQNYDPKASTDINNHDDDPMPRYEETNENKHGTRCAGEVAAVANNSVCSVGIAFNSGIGGIKMLDGDVTDSVEASSLSFNPQHIAIYSASWGPDDNGEVVDGPGPLAKRAFLEGVNSGRGGLGSIFVWASGNGGRFEDSCACDGYANNIYTLSISSTSERSEKPWYLEECASTIATTYSSGNEREGEKEIITTDIRHKCTSKHTGTSAAAPIAAGIIALALEANPKLTWRDVMFITVLTSRAKSIKSNNYIQNKRGLLVSSRYGFGLMDAGRMVEVAKTWINVPKMVSCAVRNSNFQVKTVQKSHVIEAVLSTDACQNTINEVNYIEQVEIIVTVRAQQRGLLEIFLISPMGTRSQILPKRPRDASPDGFKKWSFMSVQTWGEFPKGDWTLNIGSSDGSQVELEEYELIIHGTKEKPCDYERYIKNDEMTCHYECSKQSDPCGPTADDCKQCAHLTYTNEYAKKKCVSYCPSGFYADFTSKNCFKCDASCNECNGPMKTNCTQCSPGFFLKPQTHECIPSCSTGYFINNRNECERCDETCETCEFSSSYCKICKTIEAQDYSLVYKNNYCVLNRKNNECDSGEYFDAMLTECRRCDITCGECKSGSEYSCLSCSDPRRPFLNEGRCVGRCDEGFYLNETLQRCFRCSDRCSSCKSNANECLECKNGFKLNNKSQCEEVALFAEDCFDKNCYECFGKSKNECKICQNGLFLFDGNCVVNASEGFYKDKLMDNRGIISIFKKCDEKCIACVSEDDCSKCKDGYHLFGSQCIKDCSPGYYPLGNECSKCEYPCETCVNSTHCKTCIKNKIYFDSQCLDTCPLNYYLNSTICKSCHPTCETCRSDSKESCITCSAGFSFKDKECRSDCPDGTYYDINEKICLMCNTTSCLRCIKNANTCTKCKNSFALDLNSYTCKPCCSRALRGKIKYPACCNCALDDTSVCSAEISEDESKSLLDTLFSGKKSTLDFLIILFFITSSFFIIYSIIYFVKYFILRSPKAKNYNNIEYTALNDFN